MKKNILATVLFSGFLALGAAVAVMAAVPPPPVNQILGFPDTTQQFTTKQGCLQASPCHQSDAVAVEFHHALTLAPRQLSCYGDPTAPIVTGCHELVRDPVTGAFVFVEFRDCLRCHTSQPHHVGARAAAQNCQGCHGSMIDNPLDGHFIPTYAKSNVTPETKWDGNSALNPQNYGGCAACHQESATTTPKIFSNSETHHGTQIGFDTTVTGLPKKIGDCNWCHGAPDVLDMRACEKCHGINSLHNIQVNSQNPADTNPANIVPGGELPGYGHIGSDFDCWGCHGTFKKYAADAGFQYTIPPASIRGLSSTSMTSGKEKTLTINGTGFKTAYAASKSENVPVNVQVMVKNQNNTNSLTLTPVSVTDSEIQVVIPALESGNYDISVAKSDSYNHVALSNVALINALPARSITTAALGLDKTLTITGSGFNMEPPLNVNTGLGAFAADGSQARIISWSDSKVIVSNTAFKAGETVTVKTLNGPITKIISAASKKIRR